MGIEVLAFNAFGVDEHDAADTDRGQLCPEALHDFRAGQREQKIDRGKLRWGRLEGTVQRNVRGVQRDDRSRASRAIDNADVDGLADRGFENLAHVTRTRVGDADRGEVGDLVRLEEDQVQSRGTDREALGIGSIGFFALGLAAVNSTA